MPVVPTSSSLSPRPGRPPRGRLLASARRMARAAAVLGVGAAAITATARVLTGGPDADLALAGDSLLPDAPITATQGLDIPAPAAVVWPWLVQMGADRGGFYTCTALENLAGLGIQNADHIEPSWQDLAVGDRVILAPGTALGVAVLDPHHALVLSSAGGERPTSAGSSMDFDLTWAFVLLGTDDGCRLLVRERFAPHHPVAWVSTGGVLPLSRLLTRGLLTGVRRRVLAARGPGAGPAGADGVERVPADGVGPAASGLPDPVQA